MALYEVTSENLTKIAQTTFDQAGLRERTDLQRLLRKQINVILPKTLVIAEEFGEWEESKRRIDLLALDKDANLVVIELKRTEDGGHMELQAIRYAAMVSTMIFDQAVEIYARYLEGDGNDADARIAILEFLGWEEPKEDLFAQKVIIVLASANFSKELTTAVLWLNDHELDIRCIRLTPYQDNGRVLIDVQHIIPLPEAAEYQIQIREKEQKERKERAERNPHYYKFYENLLSLAEGRTDLHVNLSPSNDDYFYVKTWRGTNLSYVINQHDSRVGLYTIRAEVYDELHTHKQEIEAAFGKALLWTRRDTGKTSRIAYDMTIGGYKDDEANWQTIQNEMIDAMVRLEKALSPFTANLMHLK
ncbi:MAG: DUF4268 domain-containing protein [Pyrinomonadaceae bacterium]